ncbi:MAG TPA: hypothetical protein VHA11_12890 [Bryobacteraceae bacterium]|nr:hypothetical protein [Bryobacteraceae bacterium]
MNPLLVGIVYGLSLILALALLYFYPARWYWHALSLLAALALGLTPLPQNSGIPDLLIGAVFLLLFVWGAAFPLFRKHHGPIHLPRHA